MSVHYFDFNSPRYSQFPALIFSPLGFLLTNLKYRNSTKQTWYDSILLCSLRLTRSAAQSLSDRFDFFFFFFYDSSSLAERPIWVHGGSSIHLITLFAHACFPVCPALGIQSVPWGSDLYVVLMLAFHCMSSPISMSWLDASLGRWFAVSVRESLSLWSCVLNARHGSS